jgi:hypothetical protein
MRRDCAQAPTPTAGGAQGGPTMQTSLFTRMFKGKAKPDARIFSITPQRTGERTLLGVENFLGSIAVPDPFSLEIAGDAAGVALLARCQEDSYARQQLGVHYPQAQVAEVDPDDDPLRLSDRERAWSMELRLTGPEYLPLRPYRDDDLLDQGSDPLISLIGSFSNLREGERLVARLRLLSLGAQWSIPHQNKLQRQQQKDQAGHPSGDQTQVQIHTRDGVTMAILGVAALVGLRGYFWVQNGETWKAVLLGVGALAALAAAGWSWWRIKNSAPAASSRTRSRSGRNSPASHTRPNWRSSPSCPTTAPRSGPGSSWPTWRPPTTPTTTPPAPASRPARSNPRSPTRSPRRRQRGCSAVATC